MKQYAYVLEFNQQRSVDPDLINQALDYAWRYTPSKNQFMNYSVHVIGPSQNQLRELLYYKVLEQQMRANGENFASIKKYDKYCEKNRIVPNFRNIKSAPYVLIYTQRVVTKHNPVHERLIKKGIVFEQTFDKGTKKYSSANKTARVEAGMFSANFSTKILDLGLDVSYVACMPTELEYWQEDEWSFINHSPLFIQLAGYGLRYKKDDVPPEKDRKPNFEDVVNML